MRGRTNYTGGAMPVINGKLEKYEVAGGHSVEKGDFVQFTANLNVKKVLGNSFLGNHKIKITDSLYICMGRASGSYLICLISLENGELTILDTESITTSSSTSSTPNIVEYNGKYYVMDTNEMILYEISVNENRFTKTAKCSTSVKCPAMAVFGNKIIGLGITTCNTNSPSIASYEVYTVSSDGSVSPSGNKTVKCVTHVYDDVGDVYPKVLNGYIYMIGAWYGGSSTTNGGSALCFKFNDSDDTIEFIKKLNVGSSDFSYNCLNGGSFDVIEECGCFFMVGNRSGYKGILSCIKADTSVTNVGSYNFTIASISNMQPYPMLLSGIDVLPDRGMALLVHNFYGALDGVPESNRTYKIIVELLEFSEQAYSFSEIQKLGFTYEELGLDISGTGANVYLQGSTILFYDNIFYCLCTLYDSSNYSTILFTFELVGTNITFKGLKKIKKYDGTGFSIGFANSSGSGGQMVDVFLPE